MLGKLKEYRLKFGIAETKTTFQLEKTTVITPHVAPMPRGGTFARRGFSLPQLKKTIKAYREQVADFAVVGEEEVFEMFNGVPTPTPEWVFHGTDTSWDTIYSSKALVSNGENTSVGEHVFNSKDAESCYVATSRVQSVARCFAHAKNWVYLIYSTCGLIVRSALHHQAEVIIPGNVPIRDIFMFKKLDDPTLIYRNLEFSGPVISRSLLLECLNLMGDGARYRLDEDL